MPSVGGKKFGYGKKGKAKAKAHARKTGHPVKPHKCSACSRKRKRG